jgi:hypothetical protein
MDSWCIAADIKLAEHSKTLESKIGHSILCVSKWDTFVSHPSFVSKTQNEQQNFFAAISQSSANSVINA